MSTSAQARDVEGLRPRQVVDARLVSQWIARPPAATPASVVAQLLAIQSQDLPAALWAVGLRAPGTTRLEVERAIGERAIVRTWPLRGTLHLVAAADVRWLLELLAERAIAASAGRRRQLRIDDEDERNARRIVCAALEDGVALTRGELYDLLSEAGIAPNGQRGLHLLQRLAFERLICFGAHRERQPTFVLLDEWVAPAPAISRDEALARLAIRYCVGHGPVTARDLAWWAGLTLGDARRAFAGVAPELVRVGTGERQSWMAPGPNRAELSPRPGVHLLPAFDEYVLGYRERQAALAEEHRTAINPGANGMFLPIVVVNGRVVGTWGRTLSATAVRIEVRPFGALSASARRGLELRARAYGRFHGVAARLEVVPDGH